MYNMKQILYLTFAIKTSPNTAAIVVAILW